MRSPEDFKVNKNIVTNIFKCPIFAKTMLKIQCAEWLSLQKAISSLLSPETASVDVNVKILRDVHAQQLIECERCPFCQCLAPNPCASSRLSASTSMDMTW